jgi:hypothetical protein
MPKSRGKHELQRKGLVLDVGFMRPLLVWSGYWIDEGYVMSEWIKCSERMPPVGTKLLTWNGWFIVQAEYRSNEHAKTEKGRQPRFENFRGIMSSVTHRMPLPEPPAD